MKRYIIGGLIGFMLSLGVGAHAEVVSMIGKAIDGSFPIKINGKTLTNQALTIEGVSYVPTREFAELLGATIKFDANLGIEVDSPNPAPVINPKYVRYQQIVNELPQLFTEKMSLEDKVRKAQLKDPEGNIIVNEDTDKVDLYRQQIVEKQAQIDKLIEEKHTLEAANFK